MYNQVIANDYGSIAIILLIRLLWALDDDLGAAIFSASVLGVVGGYGVRSAGGRDCYAVSGDAVAPESVGYGACTGEADAHIDLVGAFVAGVAYDDDVVVGIFGEEGGYAAHGGLGIVIES